jgi:hypothetical protein
MNIPAMRAALDDVADNLEQALEQLGPKHEATITPELSASQARLAATYVELARIALERFGDAARG